MLSFLYIAPSLLHAADLLSAPNANPPHTVYLREANFSHSPDRFRYGPASTALISRNATPPPSILLSEPTATHLYPNI